MQANSFGCFNGREGMMKKSTIFAVMIQIKKVFIIINQCIDVEKDLFGMCSKKSTQYTSFIALGALKCYTEFVTI